MVIHPCSGEHERHDIPKARGDPTNGVEFAPMENKVEEREGEDNHREDRERPHNSF